MPGLLLRPAAGALPKDRLLGRDRAGPSVHFRALKLHHFARDLAVIRTERRELGRRREVALAGSLREQTSALRKEG